MESQDTPELAAFRAEARAWLGEHAPAFSGRVKHRLHFESAESASAYEEAERASLEAAKAWQATLRAGGWAAISWPEAFGGRGGTPGQEAVFAEECERFDVSVGPLMIGLKMVGPTLMRHGTRAQCAEHLPPLLNGERVWCQLYSEPGAGSDLASLRTRAVRVRTTAAKRGSAEPVLGGLGVAPQSDRDETTGDWIVTGQKVWTSSAQVADWAILLARTNVDVPKHQGITYFLVDMRTPGIEVRPLRQMNGSYHFNEVFLDEVRVPAGNVVGEVDAGWKVVHTTLAAERAMIGGGGGERARALVELARACGRIDDPVVRQHIAEVHTLDEILRFLGLRMRAAIARGAPPGPEGSIMKLLVARRAHLAGEAALAIEGARGLLAGEDTPGGGAGQQQLLSAQGLRIGGGTDFIQLNAIAERILGLPRQRHPDKDVPFRMTTAQRDGS